MSRRHIHFVTGKLAADSLRNVVSQLAAEADFEFTIQVLPITVAALMTPEWILKRIDVPAGVDEVMVPGYCRGDYTALAGRGIPVTLGPRDLRELPAVFGRPPSNPTDGKFDIEIIAEINHVPNLGLQQIIATAQRLAEDGADVIDLGCNPGETWSGVSDCVKALRDAGRRVSIDSFNPVEVQAAVEAGAELVLSVNSSNREQAIDWGCEVVVIPDDPAKLAGLHDTANFLDQHDVAYRLDPVIEPIGFGFAASLGRYLEVRRAWPDAAMMMGIGNLTELTDCDSAGINTLLLGFCQELGVRSVLTTQVINWARTSVAECNLARRLVYHAVANRVLPKHVETRLVMLRDDRVLNLDHQELDQLAARLRDNNYRIFADDGEIHLVAAGLHLSSADPFDLFARLARSEPGNLDPSHAFYLGYEFCKALTSLTLGKQYHQDEPLDWGLLTQPETWYRVKSEKGDSRK